MSVFRLDAIAADAQLTEKPTADLHRLGEVIHDGCVEEEKKYYDRLMSDPNFDGELLLLLLLLSSGMFQEIFVTIVLLSTPFSPAPFATSHSCLMMVVLD